MIHEKIAVLDFGGQYAHLIANRIRRSGVYSEILDNDTSADELKDYKGIIFSGGPMSVYAEGAPHCDKKIFELGIPILGICYGHQLTQYLLGGDVFSAGTKEYGIATLNIVNNGGIFKGVKDSSKVWMSHGDSVRGLAEGFAEAAKTADCTNSAVFNEKKNIYGVQFHPEVTHSEEGIKMLDNFLNICGVNRDWSIEQFIKEEIEAVKQKTGDKKVFLLVSGGVDSTVCFALLEKALGPGRVFGLLVDTGMMRYEEAKQVRNSLADAGFTNLHVADKSEEFLGALKGVTEPEEKRRIIGEMFWTVKEDTAEELRLNPDEWIMGQGTIYPDTIETGGTKHSDKIKTHHNRVDLVQEMIGAGKVIEPIAQLYKDEVRELGEKLGLPHALVWRQPFPGPGLGVRILCSDKEGGKDFGDVEEEILQDYKITRSQDYKIKILPIRSVGVQGDERSYRHPAVLFTDCRDWDELERVSTVITNKCAEVNRVLLNIGGEMQDLASVQKFVMKKCDLSAERVRLLQMADREVNEIMEGRMDEFKIWQFPVVLIPVSDIAGKESVVLRPIVSTEAMTASFARVDRGLIDKMTEKILEHDGITHVFYDLTHKPPGTIEWE